MIAMARIRPARTMRTPNSQAWARYSLKKPRKNFIKALAEVKGTVESLDKEKVAEVAHETVEILKKEVKHEGKEMEKLKDELSKEWKKLSPKLKAKS